MLSQIHTIDGIYKIVDWNLGEKLGKGFESHIAGVLTKLLRPHLSNGVKVHPTPKSRDGGKDVIVTTNIELNGILNQNFKLNGKSEIRIYIECKSSNNEKITLEKVMGSVARIKDEHPDYYVLVTNTSIGPNSYYCIQEALAESGINFVLVNQHILSSVLNQCGFPIGKMPSLLPMEVYAEYQILSHKAAGKNIYDIFVLYHNLSSTEHLITQNLLSDRNWDVSETEYSFIIDAYGTHVKKISVERAYADGIDDLLFSINVGTKETQVHIQGSDMGAVFETPLFGENHRDCIRMLGENAKAAITLDLCCIWGEAGVGKTRIFQEHVKSLDGQGFDFKSFVVRKNYITLRKDIKTFLIKKNYLPEKCSGQTLKELFDECKNDFHRAIILIDDCHNAPDEFWLEIKSLQNCHAPVSLLLCGRTDYSVGTTAFYSFVQWSHENENITAWKLEPLSNEDTENLVRAIIQRVPKIAFEKICAMSRNNPLFIVQFIEYLLELKLVTIINRNAVGVTNISTFSSRLYIPDKIHEIYQQRLTHLLNIKERESAVKFLFSLSMLDGEITLSDAIHYFDEDMESLELLFTRKFLQFTDDGEITFIHESLFLFFRKWLDEKPKWQKIIAKSLLHDTRFLLDKMNNLERGCVAYWDGDASQAKNCFSDVIKSLRDISNHSALNIDAGAYQYLHYIWELFKKDSHEKELLSKSVKAKIYISLHHFTPALAVADCDQVLRLITKNPSFESESVLRNSILEQKAHSLINAGYLSDGELLLKELLSEWLVNPQSFSNDTIFDLFDRLCSVYNKFNCKNLSKNYSSMAFNEAEKAADVNLLALAYLSRGKVHSYFDYEKAKESFEKIQETLQGGSSKRILCSCEMSLIVLELLHDRHCDLHKLVYRAQKLLQEAINGSYSHSIVKAYLVLAVTSFLIAEHERTYENVHSFIAKGIDCSIKYGIPTHIWQFYNLLGIVQIHIRADSDQIRRTFETVYTALHRQNLLHLGTADLCYGNILALSNIGYFFQSRQFENEFYKKISPITFIGSVQDFDSDFGGNDQNKEYSYTHSMENLKAEYNKARNLQVLFTHDSADSLLRDASTHYFIPIS